MALMIFSYLIKIILQYFLFVRHAFYLNVHIQTFLCKLKVRDFLCFSMLLITTSQWETMKSYKSILIIPNILENINCIFNYSTFVNDRVAALKHISFNSVS